MKNTLRILRLVALIGIPAFARSAASANPATDDAALTSIISKLDAQVFDAYNRCDLDAFRGFFTAKVEFYHDKGGATFDRKTVVDNTRKFICHKVRRELLPETFKVYPVKDYGAIEEGEHRFCQIETGKCEGIAKFLMIWRNSGGEWRLTRVVSYGHRAIGEPGQTTTPAPTAR